MKFTKTIVIVLAVLVIISLALAGCLKSEGNENGAESEEEGAVETIKGFAYNATENLLIAINLPSYTQFSRNFTDELKQSFTEEDFKNFSSAIIEEHGLYSRNTSKQYVQEVNENDDGSVTYIIETEFVKEGQTDTKKVPFQITYKMFDGEPKIVSLQLGDKEIKP